ncbi:MAG: hypothetical protein AB7O62_07610 [Pirellulales bacterium]
MSSELVTVATFLTPEHAELARGMLQSEGVRAYIADGAVIGNHWGLTNAVGGVKLQVGDRDVRTARRILDEFQDRKEADEQSGSPWTCPNCQEQVDANFDLCWSCGALPDGSHDPDAAAAARQTRDVRGDGPDEPAQAESGELATHAAAWDIDGEKLNSTQIIRIAALGLLIAALLGFAAWSVSR